MKIQLLSTLEGARQARGIGIVIDVFRASSHIVVLLMRGAEAIVPTATVEEARALKAAHPDWLLAGERGGRPFPDFDFGNSPAEAERRDVRGRTIILTTSAGTRGLVAAAAGCREVYVGSFLNARTLVEYIGHHAMKEDEAISFIALGVDAEIPSLEDTLAAHYMIAHLRRLPGWEKKNDPPIDPQIEAVVAGHESFEAIRSRIAKDPQGAKFLDPTEDAYPVEDFDACLRPDRYPIVPRLQNGRIQKETF